MLCTFNMLIECQDCVGAIDCTHMRIKVPAHLAPRYRGRKDYPTQNVLVACTFDLKFTYVLVGWEGTTSDSRIVKSVLTRAYPLKVPQGEKKHNIIVQVSRLAKLINSLFFFIGKYYLGDAGFPLRHVSSHPIGEKGTTYKSILGIHLETLVNYSTIDIRHYECRLNMHLEC